MMTGRPRAQHRAPPAPGALAWALLLMLLGACAIADEVADRIAALKAAGEPVTPAEVAPAPVPDDDNAALCYLDAVAALTPGGDDIYAALDTSDPATVQRTRGQVARDAEALEWVREASAKERCRFDLDYSAGLAIMLPHLAQMRSLARFLRCAAVASALDGNPAEAAEHLRMGFVLARHVTQDPILIGLLVGVAIDSIMVEASAQVMALGRIPTEQARALSAELGKLDYTDCLVRTLRTERCMALQVFGQMRRERKAAPEWLTGEEGDRKLDPDALEQYVQSGGLMRDELAYLDLLARAMGLAAQPWRETHDGWPNAEQLGADTGELSFTRMLVPTFARAACKRDEAVARRGLLQAALALIEDWYQDEQYPETLAAARSEDFPFPLDVFSGEEFVYKAEGGGVTLYSVGPNLEDDGGYWGNPEPADDIAWPPAPKK